MFGAPPISPLSAVVGSVFGGNPSASLGLARNPDDDPEERRKKLMAAAGGPGGVLQGRVIDPAVLALFK